MVQYLISLPNIDIKNKDIKGRSALQNAIFGPKGGREGKKIGTYGKDCPEAAVLLLNTGQTHPNDEDFEKNTALHVAC